MGLSSAFRLKQIGMRRVDQWEEADLQSQQACRIAPRERENRSGRDLL